MHGLIKKFYYKIQVDKKKPWMRNYVIIHYILISNNQAIQLDPKNVKAWSNKGVLLDDLGR